MLDAPQCLPLRIRVLNTNCCCKTVNAALHVCVVRRCALLCCRFNDTMQACVPDQKDYGCQFATNPVACAAVTDANRNSVCYSEDTCSSVCSLCPKCIEYMTTTVVRPLQAAYALNPDNSTAASAIMQAACGSAVAEGRVDSFACKQLMSQASQPGSKFALRPAALCRMVGMCARTCMVPAPPPSNASTAVDMCTTTGFNDSTYVNQSRPDDGLLPAGNCRNTRDCTVAGTLCALSGNVTQNCMCDVEVGLDRYVYVCMSTYIHRGWHADVSMMCIKGLLCTPTAYAQHMYNQGIGNTAMWPFIPYASGDCSALQMPAAG